MSKIYLPIGMIGSGKSTWARKFIKDNPGVKIVAGDDIRYMLAGGKEYAYDKSLESAIFDVLLETTQTLLCHGYDVILDECYCSLSVGMRQRVALRFAGGGNILIAVVFPEREMKDHIEDKVIKGLRGKTVGYWKRVFCEMEKVYEPFNPETEHYFTDFEVIDGEE